MLTSISKHLFVALFILFSCDTFAGAPVIWNGADAKFLNSGSAILPGLAGLGCAQFDVNGKITNTGSACGTGSGSGTVSSATAGQVAYYTLTGTTVGGSANMTFDGTNLTLGSGKVTATTVLCTTCTASQAVFTDGSKQLISNAITGSGNVVMSTSPTLVTPALGTPSALTLTNATGLPVSGGGTGVASFTANQVVLGGTTSTAALQQVPGAVLGNVLVSQGTTSAPSFQPISAIGISTDDVPYTPAFSAGFGTVTNSVFYYRRVGDRLFVHGTFTSGTVAASIASISLPAGLSIDTSKISLNVTTANPAEHVGQYGPPGVAVYGAIVAATSTSASVVYLGNFYSVANWTTPQNGTVVASSQNEVINFSVPISGWSSNTIGVGQGSVVASYYASANRSVSTTQAINFDTKLVDAVVPNVTTGSSWVFTASVTGYYYVNVNANTAAAASYLGAWKNGSLYKYLTISPSNTDIGGAFTASGMVPLSVGNTLEIRSNASDTVTGGSFSGGLASSIDIFLISGNGSGNVSSMTTNSEHIERSNFTCSSSSTINSQSGSWASSIGNIASGKCSVTVTAGEWSATPVCPTDRTGTATTRASCHANPTSSTNVDLYCVTDAGAADTSCTCDTVCMGAR